MNANSATTNAPTTNAPRDTFRPVCVIRYGKKYTDKTFYDRSTLQKYMKNQARNGMSISCVHVYEDVCMVSIQKLTYTAISTPGYQYTYYGSQFDDDYNGPETIMASKRQGYLFVRSDWIPMPESKPTPVKYGVRSIKDGVVLEWETFATIEDARGYAEDDIEEGATESVIIAVNRDGSLGDVVETIRPEPEPTPTIDHYRIRTVVKGVIVDGTNEPTELEARTTAQQIVDADPTGNTEAWIIPVMSDRTLGGVLDVICYIDPSEDTDWMFPDDEPNLTVRIWDPRTGRIDVEIDVSDMDDARAIVHHYNHQVFYSIIDEIDGALLESGEYFPDSTQGAN